MNTYVLALTAFTSAAASAQVYKCNVTGTVTYTDEPCLGAQRVDVTPTQGVDKLTGTSRKGADVRAAEYNRRMAEALKSVFGETPEQRATRHKRGRLTPTEQGTCYDLDRILHRLERQERETANAAHQRTQAELLEKRSQYRQIGC